MRFDLSDEEFAEVAVAAARVGLAKGAYAAQVALSAARTGAAPGESPLREALGEFIRAAGLVRRVGVNLNQAVAKVAAARRILTLIFYGLRDGQIRCLSRPPARPQAAERAA